MTSTTTTTTTIETTYPLEVVSSAAGLPYAPSTVAGGGAASGIQRQVEMALKEVLGGVPRPGDSRAIVSAMYRSFEVRQVAGHSQVTWAPHGLIGHADLNGGITGAQASLYASASVGLQNALQLLDGLTPLKLDCDLEVFDAHRAVLRSALIQVVEEFKVEGGPCTPRVEQLSEVATTSIYNLRRAGLGRTPEVIVNTIEEENIRTSYVALQTYITLVKKSWEQYTNPGSKLDFGAGLVQLSRALAVVTESVTETLTALDLAFITAADRRVTTGFKNEKRKTITYDEFFNWVTDFSTEDAPRLIREAGKIGISQVRDIALELSSYTPPEIPGDLSSRAVKCISALKKSLESVKSICEEIIPPNRNKTSTVVGSI